MIICQWNYGASGNQDQARDLISAIEASGYVYGIYSTPGVRYMSAGLVVIILIANRSGAIFLARPPSFLTIPRLFGSQHSTTMR